MKYSLNLNHSVTNLSPFTWVIFLYICHSYCYQFDNVDGAGGFYYVNAGTLEGEAPTEVAVVNVSKFVTCGWVVLREYALFSTQTLQQKNYFFSVACSVTFEFLTRGQTMIHGGQMQRAAIFLHY